ncbi:MAG TPA: PAS domain S-box protein [Candidatus Polarisedimenticolia bacterium]|nr:PAS domain S-box protein [Candidatus Polarisedimenticolia bacterium]
MMPPRETDLLPNLAVTSPAETTDPVARFSALFSGDLRLDEVLHRILKGAAETFAADRAEVYVYDERERILVGRHMTQPGRHGESGRTAPPAAGNGSSSEPVRIPVTDTGELLSATVLTRKTHAIDDLLKTGTGPRLHELLRSERQAGLFVAVPLVAAAEVVGVLTLETFGGDKPLVRPLPLLDIFASEAGQALGRARLREERERAIHDLGRLQAATAALQRGAGRAEMVERIVEGATQTLEAQRAALFVYDASKRALIGAGGALGHDVVGLELPVGDPVEALSAAVLQNVPIVWRATDEAAGHRSLSPALGVPPACRALVAAPLAVGDRVWGVLLLELSRRSASISSQMQLVTAYARQAAFALERTIQVEEVNASEQRFRQFIEKSPDGIVESTLDGRILSCNSGVLRMLGYDRHELLAMNARSLYVNPTQRNELIRRTDEKGSVESMDVAVKRKDGTVGYMNVSVRLRRGAGEPVLECIIRDVTERYEVERRLRMLNHVVNHSADAIVAIDPEGNVASWNVGAEQILGYRADEMIGKPYRTVVPPECLDEYVNVLKSRVETEGYLPGFETERLHKDGRRIPVSITVTRLRNNGGPDLGWSAVLRDITERKREEQRRRLLSSITEQSPDAILSADPDGRITSWNRGAERMFGYEASEIVGRSWLDLAPSDREPEYRAIMELPEGNAPRVVDAAPRVIDTVARSREGRLLPVRLSASVLTSDDGGDAGWSVIIRDLTEQKNLAEMSERLQEELYNRHRLEGLVGHSRVMEEVRERVRRVARFNSSVMIIGQSGTGKEIVANAIHYNSPRRQKPFVKVNCAAIPEDLLESELFGIERNVATGVDGRIGRFEMADGGTLFLDEIADMSLATQAKILRVLQEREFERVGGKKVIKVDVRIIAATNKDLEAEIKARRFRDDLFYRLNVIVITLPPLCERREDIDPLIDHFLEKFTRENALPRKRLSLSARVVLNQYTWPGNVRELEHCIERAVVMGEGSEITEADLPPSILIWKELGGVRSREERGGLHEVLESAERRTVLDALERCGWVQARAARILGISERSMWYRIKKLDLRPPRS